MDDRVRAYVDAVIEACEEEIGPNLVSAWIVGSLAAGDFDRRRSDIDLLMSCAAPLNDRIKKSLGRRLTHSALPCPAHGVDLLIYPVAELAPLPRAPRYEFSISSGVDWHDDIGLGGHYPGGLVDLAAARSFGIPILGLPPEEAVGLCPREWIIEELLNGVRWHTTKLYDPFHDPTGSNAVLNACRSLHFFLSGVLVSKSAGARWLLQRRVAPVVAEALAAREAGGSVDRLAQPDVLAFLDVVLEELDAGAF